MNMREIDSSFTGPFDLVVDASEGRLTADFYSFNTVFRGRHLSVKIEAIGIGVEPRAMIMGDHLLVQANSSIWVLHDPEGEFSEVPFGYPILRLEEVGAGLLVLHHLGCAMVSQESWMIIWQHLGGTLLDYSIEGRTLSIEFDDSKIDLDVETGKEMPGS
jgi:hypothetical protein